ncbi:MAG: SMC-Scp complex subunit ScpB, partial [Myxococcota bacterium]|nr:SMC-Scp complex subunit ScpB [Myxococcota bacterium]
MHSENDNTESSALTLNEEETTDEVLSEAQSLDASQADGELTELLQDDEDDEDEEDVILNAAMLELGSVSDDDEASVEFTDGSSNEASTEVKAEDLTASDETDKTDAASKDDAKPPRRKKKSREAVPAAPLRDETVNALEALLFASGDAMTLNEIKRVFARYWKRMEPTALEAELGSLREAMKALTERWNGDEVAASSRGFRLVHVAEGYAFRSSPEFSDIVRAMREQRPMRLS